MKSAPFPGGAFLQGLVYKFLVSCKDMCDDLREEKPLTVERS